MKRGLKTILVAGALALLSILFVAGFFVLPKRPGSRTAEFNGIVNSLRQIDGAKQQWALEQHVKAGTPASMEVLRSYLRVEALKHDGVAYIIKPLGEFDEAVLTRQFDGWVPQGTIIRLTTNMNHEFIFPKGEVRFSDGRVLIISNSPTSR
ncbi:MAG: hypothetical protein U1F83_12495 [Verrucomicrobiota bacterium]